MAYLSASAVVIHYEEAKKSHYEEGKSQVYPPLPLPSYHSGLRYG